MSSVSNDLVATYGYDLRVRKWREKAAGAAYLPATFDATMRHRALSSEGVIMTANMTKHPDIATPAALDPRWKALVARDVRADGTFYYSVKSTGVYCRPSCAARLANPANVRFHDTCEDAEAAGFRPCKRCKPNVADTRHAPDAAEIQFVVNPSSLGFVLVARSGNGVCAVLLGDDQRELQGELQRRFPQATLIDGNEELQELAPRIVSCIDAPARDLKVPLDLRGTDFQRAVWNALREIPIGSTATYAEIAKRLGMPKSFRAVAQACAANNLAVVVPCHRVVRSDGALSGYAWGVERKRTLLEREGAA
jgi:AraC family transcriptional regulator of adaptative response/methylated-DNA-[protein]-cysteine methyltransferase